MVDRYLLATALLGFTLALSLAGETAAQNAAVGSEEKSRDRPGRVEFARERLQPCELRIVDASSRRCDFVAEPIARWENPVSRSIDGFLFVWADCGRPVAVAKTYYNLDNEAWGKNFISLADRPLELKLGDRAVWSPRAPALSFSPMPGAPTPAGQPRLRLAQMRELAGRFRATELRGIREPTEWQLRLLTTPLHRYEAPGAGVVDGALFGLVATTSPEALVLVEARETGTGLAWHYAVSRCTRFEVRITLDSQSIASLPRVDNGSIDAAFFHIATRMPEYPFKAGKDAADPAR